MKKRYTYGSSKYVIAEKYIAAIKEGDKQDQSTNDKSQPIETAILSMPSKTNSIRPLVSNQYNKLSISMFDDKHSFSISSVFDIAQTNSQYDVEID